ncbi:hypothetical protein HMN09_00542800 [Mycena chlorophos]|uniref:Uncharacterized protein n=1 Tax=Mycena chlorophos TaxID=658473 RepID=A0A8H6TA14_MYCCL|nr:hypothetical protein HMN09_00542800 [Mycena chlorophos]
MRRLAWLSSSQSGLLPAAVLWKGSESANGDADCEGHASSPQRVSLKSLKIFHWQEELRTIKQNLAAGDCPPMSSRATANYNCAARREQDALRTPSRRYKYLGASCCGLHVARPLQVPLSASLYSALCSTRYRQTSTSNSEVPNGSCEGHGG